MNELLSSMKKYVDDDEKILAFVVGIFEKDNFILSYQHGVLLPLLDVSFYGKFPYYPSTFKEYSYLHIDSIDFHSYFEFTYNHETVRAKHIQKGNVERFVHVVRANMNN